MLPDYWWCLLLILQTSYWKYDELSKSQEVVGVKGILSWIDFQALAVLSQLSFCRWIFATPVLLFPSCPVADHPINFRGTILVGSSSVIQMRIKAKIWITGQRSRTVVGFDVESSGVAVTFSCLPGIADFSESFLDNLFTFSIRANHITD